MEQTSKDTTSQWLDENKPAWLRRRLLQLHLWSLNLTDEEMDTGKYDDLLRLLIKLENAEKSKA